MALRAAPIVVERSELKMNDKPLNRQFSHYLVLCLVMSGLVMLGLGISGVVAPAFAQDGTPAEANGPLDQLGDLFRGAFGNTPPSQDAEEIPEETPIVPLPDGVATEASGQLRQIPQSRGEMLLSFSPLVKQTAPAVVNVYADRMVVRRSPFAGDPFFEQFFGQGMAGRPQKQSSLGSGVIIDKSGIIVTNNHVIADADEIRVALSDGREFISKVLLKDERFDVAILKIEGNEDFPTLAIGNSDALEVGDLVLAIGNPFGVGQTVTSGIISALARNQIGVSDFGFFIQTDAAINPGNSGGALIDMNGNLIGINTAIYSRSGGSNGIGFAIPANLIRAVAESAVSGSDHFEMPYIGASFTRVTADIAEALALPSASGALVAQVEKGGPADEAGLRPGDVIVGFNGQEIEHPDALGYRLATVDAGSVVELDILGRGRKVTLPVTLSKAPPKPEPVRIEGRNPFAGASVSELTPRLAREMGVPPGFSGVVVIDIASRSLAARYGLRPGDIVSQINGNPIGSVEEMQAAASAEPFLWRFEIIRNGQRLRQIIR